MPCSVTKSNGPSDPQTVRVESAQRHAQIWSSQRMVAWHATHTKRLRLATPCLVTEIAPWLPGRHGLLALLHVAQACKTEPSTCRRRVSPTWLRLLPWQRPCTHPLDQTNDLVQQLDDKGVQRSSWSRKTARPLMLLRDMQAPHGRQKCFMSQVSALLKQA